MPDVNLLLAFAAGVLGFLSPCIVPLIPGYLSFVSGLSLAEMSPADRRQHRVQVVLGTVVFVIGFASVDRKSTRLNSSHVSTSYAVSCLKKKMRCNRSKGRNRVPAALGAKPAQTPETP